MAQNYEIDIKRFNGQDYDTLLPTPASHASTHEANGSDPLTLQTGNYGASSIPTSAYQNASVTRAKLANDALYSPMASTVNLATYSIQTSDLGKTLAPNYQSTNLDITYTLDDDVGNALPFGAEIAILLRYGKSLKIAFSPNMYVGVIGNANFEKGLTLSITERFGMAALKKVDSGSSGTVSYWLVTGNVEVVE